MKVIHVPTEISGQMGMICDALRKLGHQVSGYNWFHTYLNYEGKVTPTDAYELYKHLLPLINHAEVCHFHNGNTFTIKGEELPLLKELGKKLVMHHWGNDVRTVKKVKELNPFPLPPSYNTDEYIHERLTYLTSYIDTAIVQDYEMVPYVKDYYKHVHVIPLACNAQEFVPHYPPVTKEKPLIVHAPTNQAFKGTEYVHSSIDHLEYQGYNFSYKKIEQLSHKEALELYKEADIIVDQLLCGTYGVLSVEAMALGKVVVANIREDVRSHLPADFPIVSATPETLSEVLKPYIEQPQLRYETGKRSRAFVENFHNADLIAKNLEHIYSKL
ncbi:glycosyltransferase [Alkalicoccobacillus murimartini]|uniref:Glycosyltransferase involved in cell wall biosynthesis n=1 Tax=Alkalicoccobacillus murimartini TaxID=171685 RepID=A0ABT9YJJ7_9BACI|nr:glycosyltransferase [Alkalicoccobacillus murimartini]MDQ0207864.1 glycosyltransferase involved in cell wall biosynthesis [Alkalicoccobacillus murimartini]